MRGWVFILCLIASPCYGQSFGLCSGFETRSLYGLTVTVKQEQKVEAKQESKPEAKEVKVARQVIVRRARSSWVDASVGAWSVEKLRSHLRGELASAQHRGLVPASELEGRSLQELADIHDNLHEGYAWNGDVIQRRTVTVQKYQSSCPGGVCPTNQPVRRLFRR
jgi:hypothetical protein